MHLTNIGIFKIAQTRVNWPAVVEWLKFVGVKDTLRVCEQLSTPGMTEQFTKVNPDYGCLHEENVATDASALIALAGKRCYNSFEPELNPNVTKIRTDHAEYITNVLKSGHGSVLEHATWSFAIENVSRVFTGEMNRHRAGVAISEGSMRYIRFDDIGFTMPSSLMCDETEVGINTEDHVSDIGDQNRGMQKVETQHVLKQAFTAAQQYYVDLCNIWKIEEMTDFNQKKKLTSLFRRIIGMGVSSGGVWTINARAMRHILTMRGSVHAEEEIYDVFNRIADIMIADEPLLFGDFEKDAEGSWVPKYQKV
jgi:thymidylate synthase (FAD)